MPKEMKLCPFLTIAQQIKAKPTVITVLDGSGKRPKFVAYPAIKVPNHSPILLIRPDEAKPRPAKCYADAVKIADKLTRQVVDKAKTAQKLSKTLKLKVV